MNGEFSVSVNDKSSNLKKKKLFEESEDNKWIKDDDKNINHDDAINIEGSFILGSNKWVNKKRHNTKIIIEKEKKSEHSLSKTLSFNDEFSNFEESSNYESFCSHKIERNKERLVHLVLLGDDSSRIYCPKK